VTRLESVELYLQMGRACGAYGEDRGVHRVSVGKPEGKRPLGRPRRRWEDNIKLDLQKLGRDGVGSGWGQVTGTCGCGEEFSSPINAGNFLTSCKVYC
jgi:hypothetical protein